MRIKNDDIKISTDQRKENNERTKQYAIPFTKSITCYILFDIILIKLFAI